jgi:hypothetical protein
MFLEAGLPDGRSHPVTRREHLRRFVHPGHFKCGELAVPNEQEQGGTFIVEEPRGNDAPARFCPSGLSQIDLQIHGGTSATTAAYHTCNRRLLSEHIHSGEVRAK